MTTATTGTGTITLGSAVSGYLTFALAGVQNGETVTYAIKDGSNSEIGTGTYTSSGTTLTRSVTKSTNSDAAISLSGTAEVFITPRWEDLISTEAANGFTAAQKSRARSNIGIEDKNYLLNPSGEINQIGAGSQTDATYDFDQWLTLTQSNAITASQVTDAEDSTPYMMRSLQANAAAQRFGRIQWLEKIFCRDLRGQTVSLSARVRMSASTTLRYAVVEWTGTADTITKDVVNDWTSATYTTGNFFTSTTTTIVGTGSLALTANTLTDLTADAIGTVSSSMNNLAVFFWTSSTQAQNVTLDIAKTKLEVGSYCTRFLRPNPDDAFRTCQRYYQKLPNFIVLAGGNQAGNSLPVMMRTTPSFSGGGAGFTVVGFTDGQTGNLSQNTRSSQNLIADARL